MSMLRRSPLDCEPHVWPPRQFEASRLAPRVHEDFQATVFHDLQIVKLNAFQSPMKSDIQLIVAMPNGTKYSIVRTLRKRQVRNAKVVHG